VAQNLRHTKIVEAGRKLARIVTHIDPDAKAKASRTRLEKNLPRWLKHHGGEAFDRPWGDAHRRVLGKILRAVNTGGLFALAMPRGHGKSTILKWVTAYVLLTGRRKYVVVIAATAELAQAIIDFIRQQITESETLHDHYPHVTTYARATDGKAIKARYQLRADGKTSGIMWSKTTLVFPEVVAPDGQPYASNGAILEAHGLTGAIRGKWKDSKTGKVLRPDFVILDDPQDRSSAESPTQCAMRERIITGDVLGLAGPRKRISAVMPCTIIRKGDLADRFLSHSLHPEWQGDVCRLVETWPDAQDTLWTEYADIYKRETSEGRGFGAATDFYNKNRMAMDAGAMVSWESRVRDDEISALQTAENLLLEAGPQFWAEYQNKPIDPLSESTPYIITPGIVAGRIERRNAHERPAWVTTVIASTDVNPSYALSTVVLGFGQDQTCAVLWYGLHKLNIPGGAPAPILMRDLYQHLALHGRELASMPSRPERWAIDAGGENFDVVIRYTAESSRLCGIPAIGFTGRGTKNYKPYGRTLDGPPREQCHRCLDNKDGRIIRWVAWHTDYWREIMQRAWLGEMGAPGTCSLPKGHHAEFAEQICAEKLVGKGDVGGIMMWNWHTVPGKHDFGDAMAQGYVTAAFDGIGTGGARPRPRREVRRCKVEPTIRL
jgi:hypothetical protein